jgi:hypothetical protein
MDHGLLSCLCPKNPPGSMPHYLLLIGISRVDKYSHRLISYISVEILSARQQKAWTTP